MVKQPLGYGFLTVLPIVPIVALMRATSRETNEGFPPAVTVRAALEAAGARYTEQRGAVFAYLAEVTSHPTAEAVYHAVRQQLPRISLATVYKALDALVAAGLATKLTNGDGSARYDCRTQDHYHLRDLATGEIHDLPVSFDPDLLSKVDPQMIATLAEQGFVVTGYRLEVLGRFQSSPNPQPLVREAPTSP